MLQDTETFTTKRIKQESTEDGDLVITHEVRAKGFKGIKEFSKTYDRFYIESWTGCGDGWLKGNFSYLVDGTEIAIEKSNDYWASMKYDPYDR